jgi:hypothetical protein
MNENWYWRLAQDRQRELLEEANQARLLKEAGIPDGTPGVLKALGLVLLALPFAIWLVRAWARL